MNDNTTTIDNVEFCCFWPFCPWNGITKRYTKDWNTEPRHPLGGFSPSIITLHRERHKLCFCLLRLLWCRKWLSLFNVNISTNFTPFSIDASVQVSKFDRDKRIDSSNSTHNEVSICKGILPVCLHCISVWDFFAVDLHVEVAQGCLFSASRCSFDKRLRNFLTLN